MFNFKQIILDLVGKGLTWGGAVLTGSGIATGEQTQAIISGLAALVGIIITSITKGKIAQDVAIVAEANDLQKTTAAVIADPSPYIPVGEAAAKKNFGGPSSRN